MSRIGTAQLGEAATYALAAAYFTGFVVAVEVALGRLIY